MKNKVKLSEEVDSYLSLRDDALNKVANRIAVGEFNKDCFLKLDGLGYAVDQEESCARITLGVSNMVAFTEELIARGEPWTSHLSRLPVDIREQILQDDDDFTLSGAMHRHDRYIVTRHESGEEFPLWLTQVIYQNDDPILEVFFIGHEEGHILHSADQLSVLYSLWTEHIDELINHKCLNVREDALVSLLNTAIEIDKWQDNPAVVEAVAHLGGLFAAFQRYDPQIAVPEISPGTDTDEFRHVIWILGYRGEYGIGSDETRRAREAIYNWRDTGRQLQQPNINESVG